MRQHRAGKVRVVFKQLLDLLHAYRVHRAVFPRLVEKRAGAVIGGIAAQQQVIAVEGVEDAPAALHRLVGYDVTLVEIVAGIDLLALRYDELAFFKFQQVFLLAELLLQVAGVQLLVPAVEVADVS